jgi:cytochrome P450
MFSVTVTILVEPIVPRAILHDPQTFPNPSVFSPERYLTPEGELDPNAPEIEAAFSFGRRACPGKYMALDALWIAATSIIWAFNITRACDANGNEVPISGNYNIGLVR